MKYGEPGAGLFANHIRVEPRRYIAVGLGRNGDALQNVGLKLRREFHPRLRLGRVARHATTCTALRKPSSAQVLLLV